MKKIAKKKKKATTLSAFSRKTAAVEKAAAPVAVERQRGKHEHVMLTTRVPREAWKKLHALALNEGVTLRGLVVRGLNLVFEEKGLAKPIKE